MFDFIDLFNKKLAKTSTPDVKVKMSFAKNLTVWLVWEKKDKFALKRIIHFVCLERHWECIYALTHVCVIIVNNVMN